MDHEHALQLLPAYLDQELTPREALEFEEHLEVCEDCRLAHERQRQASARIREAGLRLEAPPELALSIRAALPGKRAAWRKPPGIFRAAAWLPAGVLALGIAMFGIGATLYVSAPRPGQPLLDELVDSHVRSLQPGRLADVASTDRHTVKPWFNGKVDFAPPVVDLAQQGYPLTGGRLDYLNGRAVAVLVYQYRLHPINLYVWPGDDAGPVPGTSLDRGYSTARWNAAGMDYWAITDAGAGELDGFVAALRAHAPP